MFVRSLKFLTKYRRRKVTMLVKGRFIYGKNIVRCFQLLKSHPNRMLQHFKVTYTQKILLAY